MVPLFTGIQIVAKKRLTDDRVELKLKHDFDPAASQGSGPIPEFMVQPMVRIGDAWKIGGSTRSHTEAWEKNGEIQQFTH